MTHLHYDIRVMCHFLGQVFDTRKCVIFDTLVFTVCDNHFKTEN